MELISFEMLGKFAHFRKFHANNTAMTYSLPPRTSIMGMLGAVMGIEKGGYHEILNSEKLNIGIQVMTPIKKSFHRLNLLSIKTKNDFRGAGGRIQTPFEIVTGLDLRDDFVRYRIFLSNKAIPLNVWGDLIQKLERRELCYPLTMGTANFTASIQSFQRYSFQRMEADNGWITFNSALNSEQVLELNYDETDYQLSIEEELMPADFIANHDRELKSMNRVLLTHTNQPLLVKLKEGTCYYELHVKDESFNIQFLEPLE